MKSRQWNGWLRSVILLTILLTLPSGCLSPRLTGVTDLMEQHEAGLGQAVNAGPEAEAFVRALADYALQLEAQIEAGN